MTLAKWRRTLIKLVIQFKFITGSNIAGNLLVTYIAVYSSIFFHFFAHFEWFEFFFLRSLQHQMWSIFHDHNIRIDIWWILGARIFHGNVVGFSLLEIKPQWSLFYLCQYLADFTLDHSNTFFELEVFSMFAVFHNRSFLI